MQKPILLLLAISVLLTGCLRPYTPSIQQGNIISTDQIKQLKIGMSQDDVQYLLGQPILQPTFNNNQWNYIYTYQAKNAGPMQEQRLSLWFNDQGKLTHIQQITNEVTK